MSGPLPDATLRWAEHEDGLLDVHLPGGRLPRRATGVLLLVHGGFWKQAHDRRHTREQARALADLGWVVATPEYRRVGGAGGWPTTAEDVRQTLEMLPELLGRIGVRPGPVWAVGHSAGGHLVLWLAATGARLDGVVALAPVADLAQALRLGLGDGAAAALLGGRSPEVADPARLLERRPPYDVRVVHGTADERVPVSLSRGLVARHPWVRLTEVEADHMALIDPASTAWPTVLEQLPDP